MKFHNLLPILQAVIAALRERYGTDEPPERFTAFCKIFGHYYRQMRHQFGDDYDFEYHVRLACDSAAIEAFRINLPAERSCMTTFTNLIVADLKERLAKHPNNPFRRFHNPRVLVQAPSRHITHVAS